MMPMHTCCLFLTLILAQQPAGNAVAPEQIATAIEQLGAPRFEDPQAAMDLLWQAGGAAEGALHEAAKATDPEIRARAAALLNKLRLRIRPETSPEVASLIDQFRFADVN